MARRRSPPHRVPAARNPPFRVWVLCGALLGIYSFFLLPDVPAIGDSAKFQAVAATLGTPHPSGYPLWVLLAHLFGRLLPWGSPAYAANLLTALFSVAGTGFLFASLRQLRMRDAAAGAAALAFGLTPTLWSQSVVAEVYTLNYLFLSAVTFFLLRWRRAVLAEGNPQEGGDGGAPDRDLYLALALYVLSFTNHLTTVCLAPGILAFILLVRSRIPRGLPGSLRNGWGIAGRIPGSLRNGWGVAWRVAWQGLAVVAVSGALSLLIYGYILWRSQAPGVSFLEMQAASWRDLLGQLAGGHSHRHLFETDLTEILGEKLPVTLGRIWREFLLLLPIAVLGLWRRPPAVHVLLGLFALGNLAFALTFSVPDGFVYFLPLYFVVALYLGMGFDRLLASSPRPELLPAALLGATFLGTLSLGAVHAPALVEQKRFREAEARRLDGLVQRIGSGAALIVSDDYDTSMGLLYRSLLERPGLRVRHLPPVSYAVPVALAPLRRYLNEDQPLRSRNHALPFPAGHPVYCVCAAPERFTPHSIRAVDLGGGLARLEAGPAAEPPVPRARLVFRLETVRDLSAALERLRAEPGRPGRHPFSGTVRLGSVPGIEGEPETEERYGGEVEVLHSDDRRIEIHVTSPAPGWLVLTEPLSVRWRATVDGRPAELLELDLRYWGVALEAGEHRVVFAQPKP